MKAAPKYRLVGIELVLSPGLLTVISFKPVGFHWLLCCHITMYSIKGRRRLHMSILNESYITHLKVFIQTQPYLRIDALPTLKDLGTYIRIKENGFIETLVESAEELGQGEIIIVPGENGTRESTVYRRSKPRGNLLKHENVDVTEYWDFFHQPLNFTVTYFDLLLEDIQEKIKAKFYDFDVKEVLTDINAVLFYARQRMQEGNGTDSDAAIYTNVKDVRERIYMRLAYDLVAGKVEPWSTSVHTVPTTEETAKQLSACPWLNEDQLQAIVFALQDPQRGITHPELFSYQSGLPFLIVRVESKYYLITENRLYDVSNVSENLPRFFQYVK